MITLNIDGWFKTNWFINKVIVEKEFEGGSEKFEFPCYRWDSHHLVVFEGKGNNNIRLVYINISFLFTTLTSHPPSLTKIFENTHPQNFVTLILH